jgi:Anti-sigma factor NepR
MEPLQGADVVGFYVGTRKPRVQHTQDIWVVRERMNKRKAPRAQLYMDVELASKSTVKLGPDIKAKIGQQLRAMYSDVVNQGVPDRFSEILRRLDHADEVGVDEAGADDADADEADADRKNEDEGSNGSSK